jgi:hypothetical protein
MAEPESRITFHFTDGTNLAFGFPPQFEDPGGVLKRLESLVSEDRSIVVDAEGALFVFPLQNVKYVQITPTAGSEALPANVIRGATIVD